MVMSYGVPIVSVKYGMVFCVKITENINDKSAAFNTENFF